MAKDSRSRDGSPGLHGREARPVGAPGGTRPASAALVLHPSHGPLDWLRTFPTVYRVGSITGAAPRLYLTQPAVSQQVRALETRLGYRLFERLPRGVAPTPAAHELARLIAPHLDALEATIEGARQGPGRLGGTVRLGGPAEFLAERVLPALGGLPEKQLRLEVRFGLADELLEALGEGDLDLVVSTRSVRRSGLESEPLFTERFLLVAGPAWAARLSPEAIEANGASALEGAPLVSYGPELAILRRYWRVVFGQRLERRAAVVAPDLRAVREAVAAGAGISVLPQYLCDDAVARGRLVVLHRPASPPENTLYLAWRSGTGREPRLGYVRELLRRAVVGGDAGATAGGRGATAGGAMATAAGEERDRRTGGIGRGVSGAAT
ncbi:MAG TPA: LysR family transcriptional regulator [Longimicrobiales bacterium]